MKKQMLSLLLALALLLTLCACRQQEEQPAPLQPFDFYYRLETPDYTADCGPLGVETRDLGAEALSDEELIQLYLQGPQQAGLVTPFPPNVRLLRVTSSATLMTVQLSGEYASLQGVDASLADACIAKTLLGLANIRRVRILSLDEQGAELRSVTLDSSDILLADTQSDRDFLELTLYFADAAGQYLLTEKRTIRYLPAAELPQHVTELLLQGPQSAGLYPTIPVGTVLLDLNVENGVCAVDLSKEFIENFAALNLPPHLILLSLANSLTELDGIDQVQIYVEGRQNLSLGDFPLRQDYTAEARVVGPSHPDLNEQDCTLCLPLSQTAVLYPLPLRVRSVSSESNAETLLRALLSYSPQNGLDNPWFDQPGPVRLQLEDGLCTVDWAALPGQSEAEQALAARVLEQTLLGLDEITRVQFTVNGALP